MDGSILLPCFQRIFGGTLYRDLLVARRKYLEVLWRSVGRNRLTYHMATNI